MWREKLTPAEVLYGLVCGFPFWFLVGWFYLLPVLQHYKIGGY